MMNKNHKKEQIIKIGVEYINKNYKKPNLKIAEIANQCYISEAYFRKIFNEIYKISPLKYINRVRLENAGSMLLNEACTVKSVFIKCGFLNACRFSREFKKFYGVSPSKYKRQQNLEM